MKALAIAVASATGLAVAVASASPRLSLDEGRAYVSVFGERVIAACQSLSASSDQRRLLIGRAIVDKVDFTTMSTLVLADSVDHAPQSEKQAFVRLFTVYFLEQMLEQLGSLEVEDFAIDEVEPMRNGDVVVTTSVALGDGDTFDAGWRVRHLDGKPKIVDVLIRGFSVASHFSRLFERRSRRDIARLNDFLLARVADSRMLSLVH
jgi:ABC-type transporter MlaC component